MHCGRYTRNLMPIIFVICFGKVDGNDSRAFRYRKGEKNVCTVAKLSQANQLNWHTQTHIKIHACHCATALTINIYVETMRTWNNLSFSRTRARPEWFIKPLDIIRLDTFFSVSLSLCPVLVCMYGLRLTKVVYSWNA